MKFIDVNYRMDRRTCMEEFERCVYWSSGYDGVSLDKEYFDKLYPMGVDDYVMTMDHAEGVVYYGGDFPLRRPVLVNTEQYYQWENIRDDF